MKAKVCFYLISFNQIVFGRKMNRFEFYEKQYFHELASRERMQTILQIPFAVVVSLVAILASFVKDYESGGNGSALIFGGLLAINLVFLLSACSIFLKCFHGDSYLSMPMLEDLNKHRQVLIDYFTTTKGADEDYNPVEEADKEMLNIIEGYYIECTTFNAKVNTYRGDQWASLIPRIVCLSISVTLTYVYFQAYELDKPTIIVSDKVSKVTSSEKNEKLDSSCLVTNTYWIGKTRIEETDSVKATTTTTTSSCDKKQRESATTAAATSIKE